MKLVAMISPNALPLPGLRAVNMLTVTIGEGPYKDWRVHVRGPAVFLISPPGCNRGGVVVPKGQRRVYEIPRSQVFLSWNFDETDTLDDIVKWSPPKEERKPEPVIKLVAESEAGDEVVAESPPVLRRPPPIVEDPDELDEYPAAPREPDGEPIAIDQKDVPAEVLDADDIDTTPAVPDEEVFEDEVVESAPKPGKTKRR